MLPFSFEDKNRTMILQYCIISSLHILITYTLLLVNINGSQVISYVLLLVYMSLLFLFRVKLGKQLRWSAANVLTLQTL